MKYSQFNSIVHIEQSAFLHNTYTNSLIALSSTSADLIKAACREGIDELEDYAPKLYEALVSNKFVIENNVDEVLQIKQLQKEVDTQKKDFRLTINPTMNCNFKCWYCYESHIKTSRMNEDIIYRIKKFISHLIRENENLNSFELEWFGGEPLLYFYDIILPILEFIDTKKQETIVKMVVKFTSNGLLINEKVADLLEKYNVEAFQITLDGYEDDHNQVRYISESRGSYSQIVKNIKLLAHRDILVRVRINYTYKNIDKCYKILEDFKDVPENEKENLFFSFHRVWQDNGNNEYVDRVLYNHLDLFREQGFMAVDSSILLDNVRHSCYADKEYSAIINYNGDIFKCTARDFTNSSRDGFINETGAIIWENQSQEKRLDSKFYNPPCLKCRLLPICNGGCSQVALEAKNTGQEYCIFSYDEKEKDKVVINKCKDILATVV